MIRRITYILFFLILVASIKSPSALSEMASPHYQIPSSVISNGCIAMSSSSIHAVTTLGQSTPLTDTTDPPKSQHYTLMPGFWAPYPERIHSSDGGDGGGGCFIGSLK